MSDTLNYGKLKIGVDWENKGWVSFNQDTYNTANVLPNTRFFDTQLGSNVGGDATKKQSIVPLGLYGLEEVEIDFHGVGGTYTLGVGSPVLSGDWSITTNPLTIYGFWIWLSSDYGYTNDGSHIFQLIIEELNSSDIIVTTSSLVIDLPDDGLVHAYYKGVLTDSTTTHSILTLLKSDTDASPLKVTMHGLLMRTDLVTDEPTWGAGEDVPDSVIDNDITSYVLQATGAIGKTNWETLLFDEGTLSLTLNNADKRFSPEFSGGDYFTYLSPYKRVWVGMSDSEGIYRLIWSGWTHQFFLTPGIYESRQAVITARQGKYNIEAQSGANLIAVSTKASYELIPILFSDGYVIPSQAGDASTTPGAILQDYAGGVIVPLFGVDFVGQTDKNYLTTLEHLAELNGNYLWLSRQGRVVFKTYDSVKETLPDNLPYDMTRSMHYIYAPLDLYKSIVVNYDVFTFTGGIEMQGQDVIINIGASSFPFNIYPTYNGKPLIGEVVLDVSTFLPVDYNSTPSMGTANAAFTEHDEGIYTWYSALANNSTDLDYRLSLVSRDSGDVWYVSLAGQIYTISGMADLALDTLTYTNPLITNEEMAENFALMQVERRASVRAWFDTAMIINDTAQSVDWIRDHSVGDVVYSREEQSGNVPKSLIIIGENFTYSPGYLQFTYNFGPTGAEVDVPDFSFSVHSSFVEFTNETVVSLEPPDYTWDFGD